MSTIIYGGTREQIEKQFTCDHKWHGPSIDELSRYYKCTECFCLDRDFQDGEEHWKAVNNEEKIV